MRKVTQQTHSEASRGLILPLFATILMVMFSLAEAGPREQAKRIHDRLAGVPPSATVLTQMENLLATGNPNDAIAAANLAMDNSNFYNVTLKNFITPWTNEAQTVFDSLNDFTATVIGMIRDDKDFRTVLSADILYVGAPSLGLPAYSLANNFHYTTMESNGVDLKTGLVEVQQSAAGGLPANATAGVMTTRAAARAFFSGGTNRAMFRFTMMNFMCKDLEQVKDVTRSPDRIRQDVSRSPGGDSRIFLNSCVGCHAGMDPMAQAFAYYEYTYNMTNDPTGLNGVLVYNDVGMTDPKTGTRVQYKNLINPDNFRYGYITTDDSWENYWRSGPNSLLGWSSSLPGKGNGAKSLGVELSNTEAFARCQVEKTFKAVCLRPPGNSADRAQVDAMITSFKNNNYQMKRVFAEAALYCKGN